MLNTWNEPAEQTQYVNEHAPLRLIVEDNMELNNFIAGTLKDGHRILRAFNGSQELLMAQEPLPDLIISDIMMPEMDGYSLCEQIKQSADTNHIAFILLSAKACSDSIINGLENYADDYFTKPFYPDELLLRAHNPLDRKHKLQDYYNR